MQLTHDLFHDYDKLHYEPNFQPANANISHSQSLSQITIQPEDFL